MHPPFGTLQLKKTLRNWNRAWNGLPELVRKNSDLAEFKSLVNMHDA